MKRKVTIKRKIEEGRKKKERGRRRDGRKKCPFLPIDEAMLNIGLLGTSKSY